VLASPPPAPIGGPKYDAVWNVAAAAQQFVAFTQEMSSTKGTPSNTCRQLAPPSLVRQMAAGHWVTCWPPHCEPPAANPSCELTNVTDRALYPTQRLRQGGLSA
jgi:hypothetical protein